MHAAEPRGSVYVSLAPSFVANYDGVGIESMREALVKLGFRDVEETAIGATIVKKEYERLLEENKPDLLISSCCHSVNLLIQKYFPTVLPYLADVLSPMQAHCQDIKRRHPGCKTVFIGPCVAKKDEAARSDGLVDAVLTFEELTDWLSDEKITLKQEKAACDESRARFFPTTGGVLKTMDREKSPTISTWPSTAQKTASRHSRTSKTARSTTASWSFPPARAAAWAAR